MTLLRALKHDLTHRGPSAWALSVLLLGFYFGLYLPSETRALGLRVGALSRVSGRDLSGESVFALHLPGLSWWAVALTVGLAGAALHAAFERTDEARPFGEGLAHRLRSTGLPMALLTLLTLPAGLVAARWLDPPTRGTRHLLPTATEHAPWVLVALSVVVTAALTLDGLRRAWRQRAPGPLWTSTASLGALGLFAVYGTHVFDPAAPRPPGERSLAHLGQLFYFALDSRWGLYGALYTLAVLSGGVFMLGRYRASRYQVIRTLAVMVVQCSFGFAIPIVLKLFAWPEFYFSYFWPLKLDALMPETLLREPLVLGLWSVLGALVLVPLAGVFFGKRWYCAWVCGCGGLANTAGEPFRHLTSKSERAWRFERATIYTVLVVAVLVTAAVLAASLIGPGTRPTAVYYSGEGAPGRYLFDPIRSDALVGFAAKARYYYGIVVASVLSGAIGVGLYPLGGTRQWCRNFCPMAAMLGLAQKLGRFRIEVKEGMCISCGMCSTHCEMGIDVRSYAQEGQSFTRAACVGCGMCATVCPRGVLAVTAAPPTQLVQIRRRRP